MYKALIHIHFTFVILFLLFFGIKALLLLTNQKGSLRSVRNKGKIFDILLGIGVLTTGLYLAYQRGFSEGWIHVKLTVLFIAVPLGIVGLKKENKVLTLIALGLLVYMYFIGETKSYKPWAKADTKSIHPEYVVADQMKCSSFHGAMISQEYTPNFSKKTTGFIAGIPIK